MMWYLVESEIKFDLDFYLWEKVLYHESKVHKEIQRLLKIDICFVLKFNKNFLGYFFIIAS